MMSWMCGIVRSFGSNWPIRRSTASPNALNPSQSTKKKASTARNNPARVSQ